MTDPDAKTQPEHFVLADGSERWELDGKLHREEGPALTWNSGCQWRRHGVLHCEDGPAVVENGLERWYIHGRLLSDEEVSALRHRLEQPLREENGRKIAAAFLEGLQQPIRPLKRLTLKR